METLHTTGDWYAKEGQIVAQDTGKTLAVIPYYDNEDEEQTANANLIAASQTLMDNLKNMIWAFNGNEEKSEIQKQAIRQAEQAIQQAINP
jgi:hypothetical protein